MNAPARLMCILLAAAGLALPAFALAHEPANASPAARHRQYVALERACPDVSGRLSENLYPAWRAIDSAAQVLVDFKLDGAIISDVQISGGHGDYVGPVRRAVRAMKCTSVAASGSSVRFRIVFQYPEDARGMLAAVRFSDEAPQLAKR